MRTFKVEGIIIKRRNFGEADRILTVITREYGKIQIKATGVRKITSRRSAHVELLNNSVLYVYKGNVFSILTEAKMLDDFSFIKNDFTKIGLVYHLCELVDGLCAENQEQRGVFDLLKKTLQKLALCPSEQSVSLLRESLGVPQQLDAQLSIPVVIHDFEVALLSLLGYWNQEEVNPLSLSDAPAYIESIIERRLKSKRIFSKLQ